MYIPRKWTNKEICLLKEFYPKGMIARLQKILHRSYNSITSQAQRLEIKSNVYHGLKYTRLYTIWQGILERCSNPNQDAYKHYGGRGIKVCELWKHSFYHFYHWAINNGYQEDLFIDRIDNNKGYNPKNCRWTTHQENCRNRNNNVLITAFGETKTIQEWFEDSRSNNISLTTLYCRYYAGFTGEELFSTHMLISKRRTIIAFGKEKTPTSWIKDPICVVSFNCLKRRVFIEGWEPELALTTPARKLKVK